MNQSIERIRRVSTELGSLRDEVTFTGGAVLPLLLTEPTPYATRLTDDVDLIVRVTTRAAYYRACKVLRSCGFVEDSSEGAPICRWLLGSLPVDFMPIDGDVLGFVSRWYRGAVEHAMRVSLEGGVAINVISAPYFLATKLEAFHDRGERDLEASRDIEDVIAVVDRRPTLVQEVGDADTDVRAYLVAQIGDLLDDRDFIDALDGHLPGDAISQSRRPIVLQRLRAVAGR